MISKVIVALRVKATPERAFDAFVREIGLWWRPNGLFRFTPGPPGRTAFVPGLGGRLTEADNKAAFSRSAASPHGRHTKSSPSPGARRVSPRTSSPRLKSGSSRSGRRRG